MDFMGSAELGRAVIPELNSSKAAILHWEVLRKNNSNRSALKIQVIASNHVNGVSNKKNQIRLTTLAMCNPGEVHLILAQSIQTISMQRLVQVPYHRGGKQSNYK